ncbi:MAG TPA: zinc metalloprotease HtpX [Candidatus Dormibacteraeota bacterium]|jgi:heat shock protein HtpX|nr:zinc metalloprotease HtpX [Candidatus Dormibacteraeota bacterium]
MWQNIKTAFLLGLLDGIFLIVGGLVGGKAGLIFAALFAVAVNAFAYWNSDKLAIAAARGQAVTPEEAPELHRIVEELCADAGMPKPRVYICQDPSPNAFATGRNPKHAAVCCTTGILNLVTARELRGVLGHELSHVRNRDILTASLAATIAMGISFLAQMAMWAAIFGGFGGRDGEEGNPLLLLAIGLLAAPAAAIIQLAISRAREYEADHDGAMLTHDPLSLANALRKLETVTRQVPMQVAPAIAPLYIVNPFGGKRVTFSHLFSTHPPIEERIARLERMAISS